jgi:hypothetical protein
MQAGRCVSYDGDVGSGWKHLAAVRRNGQLQLLIDGTLQATSSTFDPTEYDISNTVPLKIGRGEMNCFSGKMSDIRLYNRALDTREIAQLATSR